MTARVLDGQALAARMQSEITPAVKSFTAAHGRPPGLGIVLVGHDPASEVYVRHKVKAGTEVGFRVDLERLPATATLGILVCGAMIYGLGWTNWLRLAAWLAVGLVLYFGYARRHSELAVPEGARASR